MSVEYFRANYRNTHKHEYLDSCTNQLSQPADIFEHHSFFFYIYDLFMHLIICVKLLLNYTFKYWNSSMYTFRETPRLIRRTPLVFSLMSILNFV